MAARCTGQPTIFGAMRESRSGDWYTLARLALESAVRTESELLELLDDHAKPRPKKATAEALVAA
jgi:hypothetical protein